MHYVEYPSDPELMQNQELINMKHAVKDKREIMQG
jgi:hypothetical protein